MKLSSHPHCPHFGCFSPEPCLPPPHCWEKHNRFVVFERQRKTTFRGHETILHGTKALSPSAREQLMGPGGISDLSVYGMSFGGVEGEHHQVPPSSALPSYAHFLGPNTL